MFAILFFAIIYRLQDHYMTHYPKIAKEKLGLGKGLPPTNSFLLVMVFSYNTNNYRV